MFHTPTQYRISCCVCDNADIFTRVGSFESFTERDSAIVECSGTAFAALTKWLLNKHSWLHADGNAIKSLLDTMNYGDIDVFGWDPNINGGMEQADWVIDSIEEDETNYSLQVCGHHRPMNTFKTRFGKFKVVVEPHNFNAVSSEKMGGNETLKQYAGYLVELAHRVFQIPVECGVDQHDYETLREIAEYFDGETVKKHDSNHDF